MQDTCLTNLPTSPGIYLFKDKYNKVIYIGKAKSIRTRVATYFQKNTQDWKVASLLRDHASIDYVITKSEHEALLLEAKLISEHKPKYNVLLRDGQPYIYILFTNEDLPKVKLVRNKKEKGTYFGPLLTKAKARSAYRYIMQTFRLYVCNKKLENGCLDYHLGLCAGTCTKNFDKDAYLLRFGLAINALRHERDTFVATIKTTIARYNQALEFEKSKNLIQYLDTVDAVFHALDIRFSESKFHDAVFLATAPKLPANDSANEAAKQLQELLHTQQPITTIDCFDISHFQSKCLVGSCIRFINGKPAKDHFRRFKIRSLQEQNDYAALQEIVTRRYSNTDEVPDLVLIDGGKGQLNAVKSVLPQALCVSLAKREELLFSDATPEGLALDVATPMGKLLIALRDYAHHFAISYQRKRASMVLKKEFQN